MAVKQTWWPRWPSAPVTGGRRLGQEAFRAWWNAIEPLWSIGLVIVCLLIGHLVFTAPWLDLRGKPYDWGQYLVTGIVFPALLFGVPLAGRWRGWSAAPAVRLKQVLVAACLIVFAVFVVASTRKYGPSSAIWPVVLAAAQAILMTRPLRPWRPWRREAIDLKRVAVVFGVALVAWTVSVSLLLHVYVQPPVFLTAFAVAFLLVCGAIAAPGHRRSDGRFRAWTPANFVGLAIIGLMSLRTDGLFEVLGRRGAIHHWGAWTGTVDLVREGGWLLWDVPSNYGFLNILLLAAVPTETPWQAFYLLGSLAFFVVGAGFFLALRTIRPGLLNWCFAMAIAICVPMFLATVNSNLKGAPTGPVISTFVLPNQGAYRYIWAFVLVAILVWEYTTAERTRRQRHVLLLGNAAWLIGVLWSPESAFFCSGAWLPAYVVIVLRMTASSRNRWREAAAWLAVPPAFLGAATGFIVTFYAARLGHLPDWRSFVDFAQEVGLNVLVVVNDPIGPSLGMLLGFCLLAIGAVYAGIRENAPTRSFGLWIGLLGAFWATNSYGFQRASTFLHPVAYAALGVMLVLMARQRWADAWDAVVRAGMVPLLVIVLASPFAAVIDEPLAVGEAAAALATTARDGFAVEPLLPEADPSLQTLMAESGVRPEDPIVFFGDSLGNLLQPWTPGSEPDNERIVVTPHWLPGHPSLALRWIPQGRGAVYTSRFIARARLGGWMIQRKTGAESSADTMTFIGGREPWLFSLLRETHVPTRVHENADWQLVWWEYVGDRPGIARPIEAWGMFGPLPPDVVVDGRPLAGMPHPELWTQFGPGWEMLDPVRGGRSAAPGATLWVYSPRPRAATVRFTTLTAADGGMGVAVNGAPSAARLLPDGRSLETDAALNAGWNAVTFPESGGGDGMIVARIAIDTR